MRCARLVSITALLTLVCPAAWAQSVDAGTLLAAAPNVTGFRFARSVVLVVHHSDDGSLGLIVNRPTRLSATDTFAALDALGGYEGRVYVGGPLEPTRPLLLVNDTAGVLTESDPVFASIHVTANVDLLGDHADRLTDEAALRVYAGHVQWGPGQLESEIAEAIWRVLPGSVEAVFSDEPLELYRELRGPGSELVATQRDGTGRAR